LEEAEIKTTTATQSCFCTTLQNASDQLHSFTFHISENMLHIRRHLFHEFLLLYLILLPGTDVIMKLLQYFSFISVMKINVWNSV